MLENSPAQFRAQLKNKIDQLPDSPGVYLHKSATGEIIYVGKAISLKNRVRSYFQSNKNHPPKVIAMVANVADFETILTATETEALTLESNLIKHYRPRYNILLKDDKHFPYVRINMRLPFPRVEIVHQVKKDGARYFGPYLSKYAVRESIEAIRESFPLRTCKKDIVKAAQRRERPCLNYYIGRCIAPCTGNVSSKEYHELINQVIDFLQGNIDPIILQLTNEMEVASDEMAFERAALLRDRIRAIKSLGEKQQAIAASTDERDIFALAQLDNDTLVYALLMRNGKIIGAEHFLMIAPEENPGDIMASFLKQFYGSGATVPPEILMQPMPSDEDAIVDWLTQLRGKKVTMYSPIRGEKKKLVHMAYQNACEQLKKLANTQKREWERTEGALIELAKALKLEKSPERVEAFDISHTMGTDPVASMIVFEKGRPNPKLYRRFKIKTSTNDDYASMQEVLTRRFSRGLKEREEGKTTDFAIFPDLLLIDGGKGQLSAGLSCLHKLGLSEEIDFAICGLAERQEEIFLPHQSESISLKTGSPALHLIQRIRDEAHRFAITYHRSLRQKSALYSVLEDINGIGPKRRKLLFEHFVYIEAIRKATLEELNAVPGIDKRSAQAVYAFFHNENEAE